MSRKPESKKWIANPAVYPSSSQGKFTRAVPFAKLSTDQETMRSIQKCPQGSQSNHQLGGKSQPDPRTGQDIEQPAGIEEQNDHQREKGDSCHRREEDRIPGVDLGAEMILCHPLGRQAGKKAMQCCKANEINDRIKRCAIDRHDPHLCSSHIVTSYPGLLIDALIAIVSVNCRDLRLQQGLYLDR